MFMHMKAAELQKQSEYPSVEPLMNERSAGSKIRDLAERVGLKRDASLEDIKAHITGNLQLEKELREIELWITFAKSSRANLANYSPEYYKATLINALDKIAHLNGLDSKSVPELEEMVKTKISMEKLNELQEGKLGYLIGVEDSFARSKLSILEKELQNVNPEKMQEYLKNKPVEKLASTQTRYMADFLKTVDPNTRSIIVDLELELVALWKRKMRQFEPSLNGHGSSMVSAMNKGMESQLEKPSTQRVSPVALRSEPKAVGLLEENRSRVASTASTVHGESNAVGLLESKVAQEGNGNWRTVAAVGAVLGTAALGTLAYTQWQKQKTN